MADRRPGTSIRRPNPMIRAATVAPAAHVDAFFWVMGEQSYKHMRGSSSEDLIFNGSSKHTPLGMAEATLAVAGGRVRDAPRLMTADAAAL